MSRFFVTQTAMITLTFSGRANSLKAFMKDI